LHTYNTSNGVFSTTYSLTDFNLAGTGQSLFPWPAQGGASPTTDALMVNDGSGTLAHLAPGASTLFAQNIVLASGPSTNDMTGVVELNGVLYIGANDGSGISRYDIGNAV